MLTPLNVSTWNTHDPACLNAVPGGITEDLLKTMPFRSAVGKFATVLLLPLLVLSSAACVLLRDEYPLNKRQVGLVVCGNLGSALNVLHSFTRDWVGWFSVSCDGFLWLGLLWCFFQFTPLFLRVHELKVLVRVNQVKLRGALDLHTRGLDGAVRARIELAKQQGASDAFAKWLVPILFALFLVILGVYDMLALDYLGKGCVGCFLARHDVGFLSLALAALLTLTAMQGWKTYRLGRAYRELDGLASTAVAFVACQLLYMTLFFIGFDDVNPMGFLCVASMMDNYLQCVKPTWRAFANFRRKFVRLSSNKVQALADDDGDVMGGKSTANATPTIRSSSGDKDDQPTIVPLEQLLATDEGFRLFEAHMLSEFSGEHLMFWYKVYQWKLRLMASNINENVTVADNEELCMGHDLYNTFVAPDGALAVNISDELRMRCSRAFQLHLARDTRRASSSPSLSPSSSSAPSANCPNNVAAHRRSGVSDGHCLVQRADAVTNCNMSPPTIPVNVFDEALTAVVRMMEQDNYARFRRTKEYREFCRKDLDHAKTLDLFVVVTRSANL